MSKIKNLFSRLKNIPRTRYITFLAVIVLAVSIAIPTLSRYKNRIDINALLSDENNWDGTVASSYRNGTGTKNDPYIISNAKELAYFEKMLHETNYENTYFELVNDIIINNGTLEYKSNELTYTLDKTKLYLKEYTTDIYSSNDFTTEKISSINKFNPLNNFKGHFNGNYYTIYGLYITSDTNTELALFNNLKGTVENLYLENTLIYGGSTTASLATSISNATIKNVFIDGDVVGTTDSKVEVEEQALANVTYTKTEEKLTESLALPTSSKTPKQVKLTGTFSSTVDQKLTLNNQELTTGDFEINLGNTLLESIEVVVDDEQSSEITLSNLKYTITYEEPTYAITSGVVAKASSSTLTGIINKAKVYGTNDASGIIGNASNTDLTYAYNTGSIEATNVASGLIGTIESSLSKTVISKTYNSGSLSGIVTNSFINKISNNAEVTFEDSFNTGVGLYSINKIENTTVSVNNILDVNPIDVIEGEISSGEITLNVEDEINDHKYLKETLGFSEYIDAKDLKTTPENVWVYEEGYLPILYFDDLNNPIATLYVGTYSWNDLGYELRDLYIKNEVGLRIVSNDELNHYQEAYYHIHKGTGLETREEVGQITDWTLYEEMVKITEEGYYTIYVKVKDKNDNITYINSEHLIVDLNEPEVTLTMNDKTWNNLQETPANINILERTDLSVTATGGYAKVTSTKYYISNKTLTKDELDSLDNKWLDYTDSISLTECGNYVVYIRVTDAADRIKYVSSDNLVFGGYTESISVGEVKNTEDSVNITSKSSVTYNFKYNDERTYQENDTNNLVTNILLPVNTQLTLFDNSTKQVYKYKITSSEDLYNYASSCTEEGCEKYATYPLSNFIKLGQTDKTKVFSDETYINQKTKDLSITIDFSKTEITDNLALEAYLDLRNSSKEPVVSTLKDSIKIVNIYPNQNMNLVINKLNTPNTISYNSDSETEINIETYISNKILNNKVIYDTSATDKKLGIAIKLIDKDSNVIAKEYLKNIAFKVGDNLYSPDSDGITRIKLSDNLDKVTTTLKIITYLSNTKLDLGDYNFVITPFVAADGKYTNLLESSSINIPVSVTNKKETDYGFKAVLTVLDDQNNEREFTSVISKAKEEAEETIAIPTTKIKIRLIDTTKLNSKAIKVSLYKRATTIAADQTYELVDLQDYVNNELTSVDDKKYSLTDTNTILEFNNKSLENNGYELRFELYDGDRKITTVRKKFITK